ncbi:MAG: hypothetical protein F6K19_49495 [Cyanothece sp. SIO1E1]|nr:hypothetical protein [Cyanothece sp. SIO1E1]
MNSYQPISCSVYDQLEALATLRQQCQITYRDASGALVDIQGLIVDVYTLNQAEFLKMNDGTEIRLDAIVSIDERRSSSSSS